MRFIGIPRGRTVSEYLDSISWLLHALAPSMPDVAPSCYPLEVLRLVAFWGITAAGVVLMAAPVWNRE